MMLAHRRVPWRLFAGLLAALVLGGAGFWVWVKAVESGGWTRMEQRTRELMEQADRRKSARPVIRGAPIPGNAWDDYGAAVSGLGPGTAWSVSCPPMGGPPPGWMLEDAARKVEAAAPALDRWRLGLRRMEARYPKWNEPSCRWNEFLGLVEWKARLLETDRPGESLDWCLALVEFNLDLMRDTNARLARVGYAPVRDSMNRIRRLASEGRLSTPELTGTVASLERMDEHFPGMMASLQNTLAKSGRMLLGWDSYVPWSLSVSRSGLEGYTAGWRHAFSTRLQKCSAFAALEALVAEHEGVEPAPWTESRARMFLLHERFQVADPMAHDFAWSFVGMDQYRRTELAKVRLLRVGLAWKAGLEVPQLLDPFGDRLGILVEAGRIKVWSRGVDGIDNGGRGAWDTFGRAGDDAVLEFTR